MSEELYGDFTVEAAQEARAELDASGSKANFMDLKEGKNIVRFLPPPPGVTTPFVSTMNHYVKRPEKQVVVACLKGSKGDDGRPLNLPCPVCEKIKILTASRSKADQALAKTYFPKMRVYADVIDRSDPDAGPQVLAFGKMIYDELVSLREDADGGGNFTHPVSGFDVIIEKTGTGINTRYKANAARNDSELGNMEWLSMRNDVAHYGKIPSYESVLDRLNGGDGQVDGDNGSSTLGAGDAAQEAAPVRSGRTAQQAIDVEDVSAPTDDISW